MSGKKDLVAKLKEIDEKLAQAQALTPNSSDATTDFAPTEVISKRAALEARRAASDFMREQVANEDTAKETYLEMFNRHYLPPKFATAYFYEFIRLMDGFYQDLELVMPRQYEPIIKNAYCYAKAYGRSAVVYENGKYAGGIVNDINSEKVNITTYDQNGVFSTPAYKEINPNYKEGQRKAKTYKREQVAVLETDDLIIGCYNMMIPGLAKVILYRGIKQHAMATLKFGVAISTNNEKQKEIIKNMLYEPIPDVIYIPKDNQIMIGKQADTKSGVSLNGCLDFYLPPGEIQAYYETMNKNYQSTIGEFYTKFGVPMGSEGKNQDLSAYSELDIKFLLFTAMDAYTRVRNGVEDINELSKESKNKEVKDELGGQEGTQEQAEEVVKNMEGKKVRLVIKYPDYRHKYENTNELSQGDKGNDNASQKHDLEENKKEGGQE